MSHLHRQPKLALLQDHTLHCCVQVDSRPVAGQCSGCALSKARKKPLKSKLKSNHAVTVAPQLPEGWVQSSSASTAIIPSAGGVWGMHNDMGILHRVASIEHSCVDTYTSIFNFITSVKPAVVPLMTVQEVRGREPKYHLDRPEADSYRPLDCPMGGAAAVLFTPVNIIHMFKGVTRERWIDVFLRRHRHLRPFEVLFVDNKDYPGPVVGGKITMFIIVCASTTAAFKIDVRKKSANGLALRAFVHQWGITKLPYKCTVYSDNCGSMQLVRDMAHNELGMAHEWTPPYDQSVNPAEKAIDFIMGAAGATCIIGGISSYYLPYIVNDVLNKLFISPTTADRDHRSPHECIFAAKPSLLYHEAAGMDVVVRKTVKNQKLAHYDNKGLRGEHGKILCSRSMTDTTYTVLVQRGDTTFRTINTRNLTVIESTRPGSAARPVDRPVRGHNGDQTLMPYTPQMIAPSAPDLPPMLPPPTPQPPETGDAEAAELHTPSTPVQSETDHETDSDASAPGDAAGHAPQADDAEHGDPLLSDFSDDARSTTPLRQDNIGCKSYPMQTDELLRDEADFDILLAQITSAQPQFLVDVVSDNDLAYVLDELDHREEQSILHQYFLTVGSDSNSVRKRIDLCNEIAYKAMRKWRRRDPIPDDPEDWVGPIKDMPWGKVLRSSRRAEAEAALNLEIHHLIDKILDPIDKGHSLYDEAVIKAMPGRFLLDMKRSGKLKVRGVQQGHLEDRSVDGPNFNYFARVADLISIRCAYFRPDRRRRKVITVDVSHAFLQSERFDPSEPPRFLKFKNPATGEIMYFLQRGPIYGSGSAPARWQNQTLAPWLVNAGFIQDQNDTCIYRHKDRDVVLCVYVDDTFIDVAGNSEDAQWFLTEFMTRFECNDPEFLAVGRPIDFIGIDLHMTDEGYYMSMENYVRKTLRVLGMEECPMFDTPIASHVHDLSQLGDDQVRFFMTACGCIGWMANTVRIDIKHAHSRLSQHMSKPCAGALALCMRILGYLRKNPDLCLAQLHRDVDAEPSTPRADVQLDRVWSFYSDSDHATNPEPQNKRRSQHGALALIYKTPVHFRSTAKTHAKAHGRLDAHASGSSVESEVYGCATAAREHLGVSYKAHALGIPFPLPMPLALDNEGCEAFMKGTAAPSRMRHVDCNQQWVSEVRDKKLFAPYHVASGRNLSDILTKFFKSKKDFTDIRDRLMVRRSFAA